jgi:alkylated DNA nucleotide flippase Atl1
MANSRKSFELFRLPGGLEGVPERVPAASYATWGAWEVQHIEAWIRERPDVVGEELKVVTNQFAGFKGASDRLDVLALDRAGRLVVIEIKRDVSGAYQDLQALRYAAFVATFRADQVVDVHRSYVERTEERALSYPEARAELEAFVANGDLDVIDSEDSPRIILVAGGFEPGVTSTVLWLRRAHEVDISCVQLVPYKIGGELVLGSSILIPLPEAADYEVRVAEKAKAAAGSKSAVKLNTEAALAFVDSIPGGRWTAYYDVAVAGGSPKGAMAVGMWLSKTATNIPKVYRVLTIKGEVSEGWKASDPALPQTREEVQQKLAGEGVTFDAEGRASKEQRWRLEDYEATLGPSEANGPFAAMDGHAP